MCYYNNNTFEFSNGLNIILGHNGDGKSTIFTAFKWLFDSSYGLKIADAYSVKKYSEILPTDNFTVSVEIVIELNNEEYSIEKCFIVTKDDFPQLSTIKENIYKKDLLSGQNSLERISISDLSKMVFPREFREFSMFETETDTLKIVQGNQLSDLVKNFSNAKYYEKVDAVISDFAQKADRQYQKDSKADSQTKAEISELDKIIKEKDTVIKHIESSISDDEKGILIYTKKIEDLMSNLGVAEEHKKVKEKIQHLNEENQILNRQIRNHFTDYLFDDYYLLIGFQDIIKQFSKKTDNLRQKRNDVQNEELAKYAIEKLELDNGCTPLPPGSPKIEILEEFVRDHVCKICGRDLDEKGSSYIQKSIDLYHKEKNNSNKGISIPKIFNHTFIDELGLLDKSFEIQNEKFSKEKILSEIKFLQDNNTKSENQINLNKQDILKLQDEESELTSKIPSTISTDDLISIPSEHEKYLQKILLLNENYGKCKANHDQLKIELNELTIKRNKTLGQVQGNFFKNGTRLLLQELSDLAKITKNTEYERFLNLLGQRATLYLKTINIGEVAGIIKLIKKGDEVIYKSLNEDGSYRSPFSNSGAIEISIPLCILFAIADLSAEIREDESYPMIFDAPTGRFSPDRELQFFKVIKETGKQRIIVTKQFLDVIDGNPVLKIDDFSKVAKDKAFFILRERPMNPKDQTTINTNIHPI
jgi:DNA sulfur modification protein DndD